MTHANAPQPPPSRLIGPKVVAAALGISRTAARQLIIDGWLPAVELPAVRGRGKMRRLLVDVRDLDLFIERRKVGA